MRPSFGFEGVRLLHGVAAIEEKAVTETAFGRLIHFAKDRPGGAAGPCRRAALAGHFSTLLRDTVETLLSDHDVYLAEWFNARDVPLEAGDFGLDDYIAHLVDFIEELGPGTHVVAVCQPCPATLAAAAILAERGSPCEPRSLMLMAGPVDATSPTKVNDLATSVDLSWFEDNVVTTVPIGYEGAGAGSTRVPPAHRVRLDEPGSAYEPALRAAPSALPRRSAKAESIREFYDEYFAVLDMHADFYLETIDAVFQRGLLARGQLTWRGQAVDPSKITKSALLTVEGERDDVCGLGQTLAAHDLLPGVEASNKAHHLQAGVGHYGVFSGRRWRQETYPIVREFILLHA